MKTKILKTLIMLNALYFLAGCAMTYRFWQIDFFQRKFFNDNSWQTAFATFMDSTLIEEFGLFTYFISLLLFILMLLPKTKFKKTWLVIASFPILVALGLIICIKILISNA